MQMMYETIYKALVEVGLEDAFSPEDYLNFFCLGNREEFSEEDSSTAVSPGAGTPQVFTLSMFLQITVVLSIGNFSLLCYLNEVDAYSSFYLQP